jgi:hypothetical protein
VTQQLRPHLKEGMKPMADSGLRRVWRAVFDTDATLDAVTLTGPEQLLPSEFDVTGLATAAVASASLAVAELQAVRTGMPTPAVTVDRRAASAAFLSEALFTPEGWERPPTWDAIAGDYPAADGWIKLHTNYSYHRAAAEKVLGVGGDREAVAAAVRRWSATELETAIVQAGGCAAAMRTREEWLATPAGSTHEPLVNLDLRPALQSGLAELPPGAAPLAGVRVLDLTRVIAGPVCTRFLAAYGADVLRVDPRGFEEVGALIPETSAGKHCAMLDLTDPVDREVFDGLVASAHVLVTGLRPGALARLGYDPNALRALNPDLITASLDAYGWTGPWAGRRGFDSLVPMSSGIAAAGAAARGVDQPVPLPAQALDHGTGYLLAAAVAVALKRLDAERQVSDIRCSLLATANLLIDHPTPGGIDNPRPTWSPADTTPTFTAWGPARRVPIPGGIEGITCQLGIDAGPLGRHSPSWAAG